MKSGHCFFEELCVVSSLNTIRLKILLKIKVDPICVLGRIRIKNNSPLL